MQPVRPGEDVVVYGLGKSGLGAARLLLQQGARVTVVDGKPPAEVERGLAAAGLSGVAAEAPTAERLLAASRVVVSPGVPLSNLELQPARAVGKVWGEVELAYRVLSARHPEARWVGITGTNGKSTTTALAGELLRAAGHEVFVGGNLGTALSEAALSARACNSYVVELSSFQLEGIDALKLDAAAFLNLQPDHLDRYPDMAAYAAAKARIFARQGPSDVAVVNAADGWTARQAGQGRRWGFLVEGRPAQVDVEALARGGVAGFTLPTGERLVLRNKALRGAHNAENAMAAALLARACGASPDAVQRGLDSYPGLPHRMEYVRTLDGVEWINDSKATNVDSSLVALRAFERGVWLIAGGKGKGAPYAPLVGLSPGRVAGVLTVGQDAQALEAAFRGVVAVHPCGTLAVAVARARELAKSGDTVLLSPACASYDQFQNFEDRGEQFKRAVRDLT
jgi:UDP-N-acetylmuramoylalanine--D-glutamate ligase